MEPLRLCFEDVSVGDESPVLRIDEVTRTMIVRYAGASGDFNPIHHDEEFAKNAGNPTVFAMGMMNAGFLSHLLQDWMGLPNIKKFGVKFKERVWPGDSLTFRGKVVSKDELEKNLKVELHLINQNGKVTIQANATVQLPSRNEIL